METGQHLKMGQQLKLAPRLIQSMEILALPAAALEERILQELESNVALEAQEPGLDQEQVPPEHERPAGPDDGSAEGFERLRELERSYDDLMDDGASPSVARSDGERDPKMAALANTPSRAETLTDRLQHEWRLSDVAAELQAPGSFLIEYLNDDGLLDAPLDAICQQAAAAGHPWDEALMERALKCIQETLEPPGIAARDVRESLLLQLDAILDGRDPDRGSGVDRQVWQDARAMVEGQWDDLLENRLPRIEARSGIPMARLNAAREALRRLRLAPGRDVVESAETPIMPDVVVEYDADQDRYVAALADGALPVLRVSPTYGRMTQDDRLDAPTREFVGRSVRSAEWLIEALHQRRSTLLRVVDEVIRRQRGWFDEGPEALKPLEMTELADKLGLHVGTISRAVAGKWLQTPRGMVELRRFFSGGTETSEGESTSWNAIRQMVKDVIDAEDRTQPLSDEAIAAALKEKGVQIARRTVMKYREQLGIPVARHRKVHAG
ncbi:MAG: RNA polymerase factor sigma-54 [Phycisphaerales bacterium]